MNSNVALPDGPSPQARFRLFGPGRFDKRKIAAGVVVIAVFVAAVYAVYRYAQDLNVHRVPSQTVAQPPAAAPVVKAPSGAKTSAHTKPGSRGGSVGSAPATTRTGVASSCAVSDATAHLNRLLASTPNGGTLRLLTGACYRVDGTLNLTGRSHVTIDGNGATLRAYTTGTRQRAFWMLRSSSGITLRNLTLIGPNATGEYVTNLEAQHGVTVNGSTNVLIDHITVKQTYGDGVAIQKAGNGSPAQADGVIVRDSTFQTIGRQGISITHARNVTITGNYFNHVARTIVDIEPDVASNQIEHVTISNNRTGTYGHSFVGAGGRSCNVHDIIIRDNNADGGAIAVGNPGLQCHKSGFLVEGNTFRLATGTDKGSWAYFWRVDDVTIRNNRILTSRTIPGVTFKETGGTLVVTGNTFSGTCTVYVAENSAPVEASNNTTATVCPAPPKGK